MQTDIIESTHSTKHSFQHQPTTYFENLELKKVDMKAVKRIAKRRGKEKSKCDPEALSPQEESLGAAARDSVVVDAETCEQGASTDDDVSTQTSTTKHSSTNSHRSILSALARGATQLLALSAAASQLMPVAAAAGVEYAGAMQAGVNLRKRSATMVGDAVQISTFPGDKHQSMLQLANNDIFNVWDRVPSASNIYAQADNINGTETVAKYSAVSFIYDTDYASVCQLNNTKLFFAFEYTTASPQIKAGIVEVGNAIESSSDIDVATSGQLPKVLCYTNTLNQERILIAWSPGFFSNPNIAIYKPDGSIDISPQTIGTSTGEAPLPLMLPSGHIALICRRYSANGAYGVILNRDDGTEIVNEFAITSDAFTSISADVALDEIIIAWVSWDGSKTTAYKQHHDLLGNMTSSKEPVTNSTNYQFDPIVVKTFSDNQYMIGYEETGFIFQSRIYPPYDPPRDFFSFASYNPQIGAWLPSIVELLGRPEFMLSYETNNFPYNRRITYNQVPSINQSTISLEKGTRATITLSDIDATDSTATPDELLFTVSNVTNGDIELNGTLTTTFTKQDIIDGLVEAIPDGSDLALAFDVTVNDGDLTSDTLSMQVAWTVPTPAPVTPTPVTPAPPGTTPSNAGSTGTNGDTPSNTPSTTTGSTLPPTGTPLQGTHIKDEPSPDNNTSLVAGIIAIIGYIILSVGALLFYRSRKNKNADENKDTALRTNTHQEELGRTLHSDAQTIASDDTQSEYGFLSLTPPPQRRSRHGSTSNSRRNSTNLRRSRRSSVHQSTSDGYTSLPIPATPQISVLGNMYVRGPVVQPPVYDSSVFTKALAMERLEAEQAKAKLHRRSKRHSTKIQLEDNGKTAGRPSQYEEMNSALAEEIPTGDAPQALHSDHDAPRGSQAVQAKTDQYEPVSSTFQC